MNEFNHHASLKRRLSTSKSQTRFEAVDLVPNLLLPRRNASLDSLAALLDKNLPLVPEVDVSHAQFKTQLLDHAQQGLIALSKGDSLNPQMIMAVEAIIIADGSRPAVLVQNGRIDLADPTLGTWRADAGRFDAQIFAVSQSVARISQVDPATGAARPIGTAFMVARGLIATNRHVLEAIATFDATKPPTDISQGWTFKDGICVDFGAEYQSAVNPVLQFVPMALRFCGSDPINGSPDFSKLDMALIELRPEANKVFPKPLALMPEAELWRPDMPVYAMGFPSKPRDGDELDDVLDKLYGGVFDVKRWSPGRVQLMPGTVPNDVLHRCFSHDCSTLGGNSGACLVDLNQSGSVVGLHFGGQKRYMNYAHVIRVVTEALNG